MYPEPKAFISIRQVENGFVVEYPQTGDARVKAFAFEGAMSLAEWVGKWAHGVEIDILKGSTVPPPKAATCPPPEKPPIMRGAIDIARLGPRDFDEDGK